MRHVSVFIYIWRWKLKREPFHELFLVVKYEERQTDPTFASKAPIILSMICSKV